MLIDITIKDTGAVEKNFEECSLKTTLSNEKIYRGQSAISEPRERQGPGLFSSNSGTSSTLSNYSTPRFFTALRNRKRFVTVIRATRFIVSGY